MNQKVHKYAGYTLLGSLGQGGTANVFLAEKPGVGRVALKVLRLGGSNVQVKERFVREIQALKKLDHPRILKIYESGEDPEGRVWYTMEFSQKRSLEGVLAARLDRGGSLSLKECLALARGLAESLEYLHQKKVIHRDLKPDNLLVDEAFDLTVMDFGLAKDFDRSELTAEGMIMGTPRYMSPEQVQGKAVQEPSDVYQVGLILYRCLAAKLPLEDKSPFATAMRRMSEPIPPVSQARPDIPPGLERIVLKSLQFHPEERYPHMGAFREDLDCLDPQTGDLLPGRSMPGALAESSLGAGGRSGDPMERTFVRKAPPAREAPGNLGEDTDLRRRGEPRPEPDPGRRRLILAAAALAPALILGGLWLSKSPPSGPPKIEGLDFRMHQEKLSLSFQTDRLVRSHVRLDPPDGPFFPIAREATRIHAGQVDLPPGASFFQLVFEDPSGTRFELEPTELKAGSGGGLDFEDRGDRIRVRFQTEEDSTVELKYRRNQGPELKARTQATGGTQHVFEVRGLTPQDQVEVVLHQTFSSGRTRSTPPTALR